jgi:hypothetical protein
MRRPVRIEREWVSLSASCSSPGRGVGAFDRRDGHAFVGELLRLPCLAVRPRPAWRDGRRRAAGLERECRTSSTGRKGIIVNRSARLCRSCRRSRRRRRRFHSGLGHDQMPVGTQGRGSLERRWPGKRSAVWTETLPSGAEAPSDFGAISARLKPCPFKTSTWRAGSPVKRVGQNFESPSLDLFRLRGINEVPLGQDERPRGRISACQWCGKVKSTTGAAGFPSCMRLVVQNPPLLLFGVGNGQPRAASTAVSAVAGFQPR